MTNLLEFFCDLIRWNLHWGRSRNKRGSIRFELKSVRIQLGRLSWGLISYDWHILHLVLLHFISSGHPTTWMRLPLIKVIILLWLVLSGFRVSRVVSFLFLEPVIPEIGIALVIVCRLGVLHREIRRRVIVRALVLLKIIIAWLVLVISWVVGLLIVSR